MRLHSITIEGFRGFSQRAEIDLAADVIILHGPNGLGKTSLLDAILWAITGAIDRFGGNGSPVSLYAREGIARVALRLEGEQGVATIIRTTDGTQNSLRYQVDDEEFDEALAETRLVQLLLPHLSGRSTAASALANIVTRGVYLQQDLVRQFIESDTPAQRFALLSEVIGAGVVIELQQILEKSRNQWARSTNAARSDLLQPVTTKVAQIREQLARLDDDAASANIDAKRESEALFQQALRIIDPAKLGTREAPTSSSQLDRFLKEIAAERTRLERELVQAVSLKTETEALAGESGVVADMSTEQAEVTELEEQLATLNSQIEATLSEVNHLLSEQHRQQDRIARLSALARLALDELTEQCPVCLQVHDIEKTRKHLTEMLEASPVDQEALKEKQTRFVLLTNRREELQTKMNALLASLREAQLRSSELTARRGVHAVHLHELGIALGGEASAKLAARIDRLESVVRQLGELLRSGEQLSVAIIRLGEQRKRSELTEELQALTAKSTELQGAITKQESTHTLAGKIIDGLRGASLEVTRKQVESVAPLFQRIYSRIDPHPTFRVTEIITALERGKGLLRVGVADPQQGGKSHDPGPILSSSQLNSFAVSLFLSLNLALPSVRLDLTMLDDPLQSLDSINLLGLVDVLRRFRANRQIVVSTHEPRFLGLLQRKLRPVRPGERLLTISFEGWSRAGPDFKLIPMTHQGPEPTVLAA